MKIESTMLANDTLSINFSWSSINFIEAMFYENCSLYLVAHFLDQFEIDVPEIVAETLQAKFNNKSIDFTSITNLKIQL